LGATVEMIYRVTEAMPAGTDIHTDPGDDYVRRTDAGATKANWRIVSIDRPY
jgi:hypothetical protein